jgi:deoxyadenosine/deoxycytidine kinase
VNQAVTRKDNLLDTASYIVVEGPIGAGKTSLAKRLSGYLKAELFLESAQDNPFLARFYQNPARWALATQISFLHQRVDQFATFSDAPAERRVVSDFLMDKDPLFAELNLPTDELALYQRLFDELRPRSLPTPDLVIYLQARPETLIARVHNRGLDSERPITESYLQRVAERYAAFFYEYDAAPLFIVDAEVLNPVDHEDDFDMLLERLRNMRSYREFFGYAG